MILRLVDQGLLRLDAPLSELLADLDMQEGYRSATLTHVLSHTAGIQPYTRIGPNITPILWELKGTPREQRAQFLRHVLAEPPVARPGERFNYSNAGFSVAAAVAERITDKSWEQLIQQQVFEPLGLKSATTDDQAQVTPAGHRRTNEGFVAPARQMPRLAPMAPAGGVRLNIVDFVTFASLQADVEAGRPAAELTAEAVRAAAELRPADAPPGPGIYFGGDGLYTAAFAIWPEKRVAIAVASNAGESDDLCARVIEALRAALAPDLPPFAVEAE
jgi:CubicO group peptidase (beta-lactamase class C family)